MNASTQNEPQSKKKGLVARHWWVVLSAVAVVLVVISVAAAKIAGSNSDAAVEVVPVDRGDLNIVVTESGSIRAHKSVQYPVEVERRGMSGDITILSVVPAGTYVTQQDVDNGMVLAQLDSSALERQLLQEQMELGSDQENVASAKEAYDIQVIQNESDIADSQLSARFALMDLQKYVGMELAEKMIQDVNEVASLSDHIAPFVRMIENDPNLLEGSGAGQELKNYNDDIVLAKGNLSTARARLDGTRVLYDANYVSDLDIRGDELSVTSREFSYENSQVSLNLFLRYDFPKNCEQYLSDYVEAGRELERTSAQCRSRLARARATLSYRNRRYASQLQRVDEVKQQIANCTIRAKAPGLVTYGPGDSGDSYRRMRRRGSSSGVIAEGESVYTGQVLISMPDMTSMVAEVSIHETEISGVRPGQRARIVMDAFPEKVLQGRVLEVAPLPDQNRGFMGPDLKVYKTLIQIDGTHDFLKTRMSCKVDILVQELNDVLVVPTRLVASRGGQKVVYVKKSNGYESRAVTTGPFNDKFVQIVGGLHEGEQVLVNPPQLDHYVTNLGFEQDMVFCATDPNLLPTTVQQASAPHPGGRQDIPNGEMDS